MVQASSSTRTYLLSLSYYCIVVFFLLFWDGVNAKEEGEAYCNNNDNDPRLLWISDVVAQPTDMYLSQNDDSTLYVFGGRYNPSRILSLDITKNNNIGTILKESFLNTTSLFNNNDNDNDNSTITSSSSSSMIMKSVVVYEKDITDDFFAIISIKRIIIQDDTTTMVSRKSNFMKREEEEGGYIVCYDLRLQIIRWKLSLMGDLSISSFSNYGKAIISSDGTTIFQHFPLGEVLALDATSGSIVWKKTLFPTSGWTYINGSIYGGILNEQQQERSVAAVGVRSSSAAAAIVIRPGILQLNASNGNYQSRWRSPHSCSSSPPTDNTASSSKYNLRLTSNTDTIITTTTIKKKQEGNNNVIIISKEDNNKNNYYITNCNNIWTNGVPSHSGLYIYFIDDILGLTKFNISNIASGPIWNTAIINNTIFIEEENISSSSKQQRQQKKGHLSQRSYIPPLISYDDTIIFASTAYHATTVAVNATDGVILWTTSTEEKKKESSLSSWMTRNMVMSKSLSQEQCNSLYVSYDYAIHKVTSSGRKDHWSSNSSLLNTVLTINNNGTMIITAGINTIQVYDITQQQQQQQIDSPSELSSSNRDDYSGSSAIETKTRLLLMTTTTILLLSILF